MKIRLDKFLSNLKYGSRSEVVYLINQGLVKIDDKVIEKADLKFDPNKNRVYVNDNEVFYQEQIILALNKPINFLSANSDNLHQTVFELIDNPYNRFDLKIAGRLDLDAQGLLILTNDGQLVHKITSPNSRVVKKYEVLLDKPFTDAQILLKGISIKDKNNDLYLAKALNISVCDKIVIIDIDEGKFHQVKRMFKEVGYEVLSLKRIQIGKLSLDDLDEGKYKEVKESDIL